MRERGVEREREGERKGKKNREMSENTGKLNGFEMFEKKDRSLQKR